MLVVTKCSLPSSTNGRVNTPAIRWAISIASCSPAISSSRIPNSSPPKRATVSLERTACLSRGAAAASSSSPTSWPRLSLTSLKRSRSRNRIAVGALAAAQALDRLLQAVHEQHPVGQAGERIVQRPVADVVVGHLALERVAEHVGERLGEVDVARR